MKIALVIGKFDALGGGAERWTARHAEYLLAQGHEVHLVSRRFREAPNDAIRHQMPHGPGCRLSFGMQTEKFFQRERFDVVHDMGDGWSCDVFSPHHGTRQGGFERNSVLAAPWTRAIRRWAIDWLPRYRQFRSLEALQYTLQPGKVFVALSEMVRADMLRCHHVPPERVRVIYNGVDVQRFRPPSTAGDLEQAKSLRRDWGFSGRTVFLLVAHNFRLKGLDTALRALATLLSEGRSAGLVVVGEGKIAAYEAKARRLGCGAAVQFVGNQADPLACYHAADVYVQPTYYDPCSLVVLEALACGLPVLTSRYNGAGELIEPGVEGFIVPEPGDANRLAEEMRRLLDPAFRAKAAAAARRLAERNTQKRNSELFLQLYRQNDRRRQAA